MIAVSNSDFFTYGCPNCGCDTAIHGNFIFHGTTTGTCEECHMEFVILPDGIEKSKAGFGTNRKDADGNTIFEYPKRIPHPRHGIPKHAYEWPDPRPENGGEYWNSRGIGYDLSGFVKSKQAGERLLAMVKRILGKETPASWLDYRPHEPKWIQFKFQESEFDLKKLHDSAKKNNGVLTLEILRQCRKCRVEGDFRYYEVRFGRSVQEDEATDFWMCIKADALAKPTLGNLQAFLAHDLEKHPGLRIRGVYPLDGYAMADVFYDLTDEPNWPVFTN